MIPMTADEQRTITRTITGLGKRECCGICGDADCPVHRGIGVLSLSEIKALDDKLDEFETPDDAEEAFLALRVAIRRRAGRCSPSMSRKRYSEEATMKKEKGRKRREYRQMDGQTWIKCGACDEFKPIAEFWRNGEHNNGDKRYGGYCKACCKKNARLRKAHTLFKTCTSCGRRKAMSKFAFGRLISKGGNRSRVGTCKECKADMEAGIVIAPRVLVGCRCCGYPTYPADLDSGRMCAPCRNFKSWPVIKPPPGTNAYDLREAALRDATARIQADPEYKKYLKEIGKDP